jgi:hypothetical protein
MPINFRDAQRLVFEFLYQNRTSNNLQLFTGIPNTGLVQLAAREGIEITGDVDNFAGCNTAHSSRRNSSIIGCL